MAGGYSLDTTSHSTAAPNISGPTTSGNVNIGGDPNIALLTQTLGQTAQSVLGSPWTLGIIAAAVVVVVWLWKRK